MSVQLQTGPGYCYFQGTDGKNYGLTLEGFVPIPMTQFIQLLSADFQRTFGKGINLGENSPDGMTINIFSEMMTLITQLDKAGYDSRFPDTAQGRSLANVCAITNFGPLPPSASVLTGVIVTGTPGTVILDSFQGVINGSPTSIFQVKPGQAYTVGSGGTVNIDMIATQTGPIPGPSGSLLIYTPQSGITGISNPSDATLGSNLETDAQIRQRRLLTLAQAGPNLSQIISAILQVPGVTNAGGIENDTDTAFMSGVPAHSVAILVQGTASINTLAGVIYKAKSAGIQTYGNESAVVIDSQGNPHTISLSAPTQVQTYFGITVIPATNPLDGIFPANGAQAILSAALNYLALQLVGQDVVLNQLSQYICAQVPGIVGITITAGFAPSPVGTSNLSMLFNQLAVSQASQITVTT